MASPVGIRAEDKNRWERRAPLTPDHVRELTADQGLRICLEPSELRVFAGADYLEAGAELAPGLPDCAVILGVKEIPPEKLLAGRTYVFFSHVIKGQAYNMPLLRRLMELGCTLIDYERIVDYKGRRLIFFGRHAGYAGMIDTLWAFGQRLAAEGASTPLDQLRPALGYDGLDHALSELSRVGEKIRSAGFPQPHRPIACAFTGSGNVTRGAQEVFERLPISEIDPDELLRLPEDRDRPRNVFYRTQFERRHRYRRRDGGAFDADELAEHPARYESALGRYLPHLTLLVHGAYWEPPQPPLVTRAMLRELFASERQPKLRVLGDISCDIEGGIEATVRSTTPGEPVFVYDPDSGRATPGVAGRGVVVMAVENLPCELPVDASHHFGDSLVRFVGSLARCDWRRPLEDLELQPELRAAIVVHRGRLTPDYHYLERPLSETA